MHPFLRLARVIRLTLLLGVFGLAPFAVWAQPPSTPTPMPGAAAEEAPSRSYVLGYALTTLCIGLGVFAVVKPGKRRYPKIKRRDDEEEVKPKH